MRAWLRVCAVGDLVPESVARFDANGETYAIIRARDGAYYAVDGYCTHEQEHLSDGQVIGFDIECPRHYGAFDFRTGEAVLAPACVDLRTYPVKIEADEVFIAVD